MSGIEKERESERAREKCVCVRERERERERELSSHMCLDCLLQLSHTPLVASQRSEVRGHIEHHSLSQNLTTLNCFLWWAEFEEVRGQRSFTHTCSSSCQVVRFRISCRRNASSDKIFCSSSSNSGSTVYIPQQSHSHTERQSLVLSDL